MSKTSRQFYTFLTACSGNWRNTIHITSQRQGCFGHLLAFDRDGLPIFIAIEQFQKLSNEQIDSTECCGQLSQEGFKSLFTQYILWHTVSDEEVLL